MLRPEPGFQANGHHATRFGPPRPARQSGTTRRVLVVNGHPDPRPERFCAALCRAYADGARSAGSATREVSVGALPGLTPAPDEDDPPDGVTAALEFARWASALTIVFPLWLDRPPAPLRRFFDHVARVGGGPKAARLVVTMELPGFAHRTILCGTTNPMALAGVDIGALTLIGSINTISDARRADWLEAIRILGMRGL